MHGYPQIIFVTHNLLYSNVSTMYNTNQAVKAARRGQGWVDMGYNENVTSPPSEI